MKKLRFSGRAAVVCSLILALGVPSVAMGFGEGRNLLLGKRNPSSNPSLALTSETEIIANNSTYGTRQSNKRDGDGGGAIYGCRSNPGNEPCIRAANLKGGRAFEFHTVGAEAGQITVGNPAGAPFTTNATGVATGLNADKVDGKDATDFAPAADVTALQGSLLFAVVGADAAVSASRPAGVTATVSGSTYTVKFARDVSKCSFTASPVGSASEAPGVQPTSGAVDSVTVETGTNPGSFNLQVIC
ncbi:MAG TPA: hypothetical protein VNS09_15120 [Solirubrobacter sp.]|nr:hypothetical protein [Solirubrobacter sp.]